MMPVEKLFPTILIIIDVIAALVYGWGGNNKLFIYWMAAATLTYSVTWMK